MNIDELNSIAEYLGACPSPERMRELFTRKMCIESGYADCEKLVFSSEIFIGGNEPCGLLRPPDDIANEWRSGEYALMLNLFVSGGQIIGGQIHKLKKISYDDGTYRQYETEPEGRDLAFVRSLLDYVTESEKEKNVS